jgi:guanylate kinase
MWVEGWGHLPGRLIVVSGPSGSGKSTIIRRALQSPEVNVELSVSATTREPRPGERDGIDYYFKTLDDFNAVADRGEFLEYALYNGQYYGTPAKPVYESLSAGKTIILEIEVNGALQVRDHAPSALFIFIRTPEFRILEERLRSRGTDSDPAILRRLRAARRELAEAHWYDVQLINDDLDRCVGQFLTVLKTQGRGG